MVGKGCCGVRRWRWDCSVGSVLVALWVVGDGFVRRLGVVPESVKKVVVNNRMSMVAGVALSNGPFG